MSYININPANQGSASGGTIFVPQSGTLPVAIVGSLGGSNIVDVISSPDADDTSTNTDSLATVALNYGYNDQVDAWTRPRTFAWSSGLSASSGFGFRNTLPISGYVLGTASVITDLGGSIANIGRKDQDNESPEVEALETQAFAYAYREVSGVISGWNRLRAIAVDRSQTQTSGYLMPTSGYFLGTASVIIDDDGQIADVGRPNSDSIGPSQTSLATIGFMHGYHRAESGWARLSVALASGNADEGETTYSGYAMVVSMGDAGNLAHITPTLTHGEIPNKSLFTAAFLMGNDSDSDVWYKIGARQNSDGSSGFSLSVSDMPVANNIDVSRTTCTNLSGGTVLPSFGVLGLLQIQNESGNNVVNVGGNNTGDFPSASTGFQLFGGQSMTLKIANADMVAVWAATSGERIRILATN